MLQHLMPRKRVLMPLICAISGWAVLGYSWNLEMESNLPGGDGDRLQEQNRDRENREADERVRENERTGRESSQSDLEKSRDYDDDHMV